MLIHASMIRKFMKIALALNSYKQMQEENTHELQKYFPVYWYSEW